ncbi:MAG: ABC transporter substrate binding protein [Pseudomonadota bacterium]
MHAGAIARVRTARVTILLGWLAFACLALSWHARADQVWIALSSREPAYLEAASALRANLPDDEVRIGEWGEFNFRAGAPHLLVTVGTEAFRQLREASETTRLIAILTPRSTMDELRGTTAGRISGVYFEQSFARQARLLHAAFPDKPRVGMVLGPSTVRYRNEIAQALRGEGMEGVFEVIQDKAELPEAVQRVLSGADVFLALPDAEAISNQTAKFILLATYRRGLPLVGYSSAFVKAGAAVAMVSSPTQIGKEAARMARDVLAGRRLPPPRPASEYDVLVNSNVSRSLGLGLDETQLEARLRDEGDRR